MIDKCFECTHSGRDCIPFLMTLPGPELIAWCRMFKKRRGWTNDDIAARAKVPEGTIDRLLSKKTTDFKFSTIRPIICALAGCSPEEMECAALPVDNDLQEKVQQLEADIRWRDDKIQHFTEENKHLHEQLKDEKDKHDKELAFLRSEIKRKNRFTTAMTILAVVALLYIIVTLIIDLADPSRGYYWLESVLHLPQSIIDTFGTNM